MWAYTSPRFQLMYHTFNIITQETTCDKPVQQWIHACEAMNTCMQKTIMIKRILHLLFQFDHFWVYLKYFKSLGWSPITCRLYIDGPGADFIRPFWYHTSIHHHRITLDRLPVIQWSLKIISYTQTETWGAGIKKTLASSEPNKHCERTDKIIMSLSSSSK